MTFLYEWTGGLTSVMTFMYRWTGEMTSIINSLSLDWLVDLLYQSTGVLTLYHDLFISMDWCFDLNIMTSLYQWWVNLFYDLSVSMDWLFDFYCDLSKTMTWIFYLYHDLSVSMY